MLIDTDHMLYFAIDGDDVGIMLRSLIIANDIEGSRDYSKHVTQYFEEIAALIVKAGGSIVFCGGDSILASASEASLLKLINTIVLPKVAFSGGIGLTPEMAYLALQLAKARGKNRIVQFCGTGGETI